MFHPHMPGVWFPLTAAAVMLGGMVQGVIWAAKEARHRHRSGEHTDAGQLSGRRQD